MGRAELTPRSSPRENAEFFNFLRMIKFANFEFTFAIRGPKLAGNGVVDKLIKHKIGFFFYMHPWNDFGGTNKGVSSPRPWNVAR